MLVQFAPAGQVVSPPPLTVARLLTGLAVLAATLTGTVMTMGVLAPAAIVQPARLVAPTDAQPLSKPLLAESIVIFPLVVTPAGSTSAIVTAEVVGALVTLIVMV